MCLPGNENRADDHGAMCVCGMERRRRMCSDQKSRVATVSQAGSTRTGCREYMTTRAFRMAKAASGGGLRKMGEMASQRPLHHHRAGYMWRNIPSFEYRVFRRHPLPGALEDLMPQLHSLYGRISPGNGVIMTFENKHQNTGLRHIYMHRSLPIYSSSYRFAQLRKAHLEASSAALIASQLAFASPNNILVLGA
jgi:hypothetical protein